MSATYPTPREFNRWYDTDKGATAIRYQKEEWGYPIFLVRAPLAKGGFVVATGCRWFTLEAAINHWTKRKSQEFGCECSQCRPDNNKVRARARQMLKLLPTLKRRAARYGWLKKSRT